jgi:hypothetical protein
VKGQKQRETKHQSHEIRYVEWDESNEWKRRNYGFKLPEISSCLGDMVLWLCEYGSVCRLAVA